MSGTHRCLVKLVAIASSALLGAGLCAFAGQSLDTRHIVVVERSALSSGVMSRVGQSPDRHVTVIEGADRSYLAVPLYGTSDGLLNVSVKRYEQVTLELRDWPIDEVMHFISGQVEIVDIDGRSRVYGPGDTIVMPRGFSGRWRQLGTVEMSTVEYGTWR